MVPAVARELLPALSFRPDQLVVNLVSTVPNAEVPLLASTPPGLVVKAVPLPPVAHGAGATVVCPAHAWTASVFGLLGDAVQVDTEITCNASEKTASICSCSGIAHAIPN